MKKERQEKIEHQNNKRMQQLRNNAKDTILERELFTQMKYKMKAEEMENNHLRARAVIQKQEFTKQMQNWENEKKNLHVQK